jgi:hypothetical protein
MLLQEKEHGQQREHSYPEHQFATEFQTTVSTTSAETGQTQLTKRQLPDRFPGIPAQRLRWFLAQSR